VDHAAPPPETLRLISDDPDLAEQYRQAVVNYQVADLLSVRAMKAEAPAQAAAWRRRAADRRQLGNQLVEHLLERLPAARRAESEEPAPSHR
jgi:hypothetical protein